MKPRAYLWFECVPGSVLKTFPLDVLGLSGETHISTAVSILISVT